MGSLFRYLLRSNVVLAHAGQDYLILDDVSQFGLHRRHVIRDCGLPDHAWVDAIKATVRAWEYTDEEGIGHLWMA